MKRSRVQKLHDLVKIAVNDPIIHRGTLTGEYLRGIANGLICALAIFKSWKPIYVEYLKNRRGMKDLQKGGNMTKIVDYHAKLDAERIAKKAELDPTRVPGYVVPKPKKGKKGKR